MVTAPIYTGSRSCVATVGRMRLLELHGLTGAGVFVAAGATGLSKGRAAAAKPPTRLAKLPSATYWSLGSCHDFTTPTNFPSTPLP